MTNLTDTERKYLIRRAAAAISQLQDGEDAIGVLSGIYCENLPDKSPRQGELMARELLDWIGRFQHSFDEALEGPENFLCRTISELFAQLPLEEQCELLGQELGIPVEKAAVSEPLRDSLLREASSRLMESDTILTLQPGSIDRESIRARNAAKDIVGEEMLLAVTSMVVYTMAKNGELSDVPEKISLAQVAIGVCMEDKLAELSCLKEMNIENQLWVLKAACVSTMLATVTVVGAGGWLMGLDLAVVAAFCGYVLLWLGLVLSIYYKTTADMIREEAADIPYIPLNVYPVETVAEEMTKSVAKCLPWPERQDKKNKAQVKPKVLPKS